MKLSVVSPVYNAELFLEKLVKRISNSIPGDFDNYELVLVEDGSRDATWSVLKTLSQKYKCICAVKLSRNFGQHYAITAGIELAKGDWIVVMDCDLQDQPEEISGLYNKTKEGYDIVLARRAKRRDTLIKRTASRAFYQMFSYLTDTHQDSTVANFGIYSRRTIDAILSMKDSFRVFTILVQWIGFRRAYVDVKHDRRISGTSNYNLGKLFRLSLDMVISFSEKPLRLGLKAGMLISLGSFLVGTYYLVQYFGGNIKVPGFASIIILLSFSTGVILTFLGLIGLYLGKILTQVKNRPYYVVEEIIRS